MISNIDFGKPLIWNVGVIVVESAIAVDKVYLAAYHFLDFLDVEKNVIWKVEELGFRLMKRGNYYVR